MLAFILQRLIQAVVVMVTVAFIAFLLFQYVGDPVVFLLGQDATKEQIDMLRADLGLDQPFFVQFGHFLYNAVQGEFGLSLRQGAKVSQLIADRFPATLELALMAAAMALLVGIPFGLAAMLFSKSTHWWGKLFTKYIIYPPFRPFIGGIVIAIAVFWLGTTQFIGLGIPTIVESFQAEQLGDVFLLKILFTGFTLGAGFKGGEVTPLFFVGATLGSFLSIYIPLPTALLAGMGFVAVFSGATHTPIACTVMGMELFGIESGLFIGIACLVSYLFSGMKGIYSPQLIGGIKGKIYQSFKKSTFENL